MQHDLIAQARTWLAEDPDPETRAELGALIEAGRHPGARRTASRARSSSAPPDCAASWARARCG